VQGVLDTLGYIALLAGGLTAFPGMTAVIGSTFGFVTILFARLFIGERLGAIQWLAVALSFAGIAWLVGSS
jgi:drug/metabolite transporter (DMT)-like permease